MSTKTKKFTHVLIHRNTMRFETNLETTTLGGENFIIAYQPMGTTFLQFHVSVTAIDTVITVETLKKLEHGLQEK